MLFVALLHCCTSALYCIIVRMREFDAKFLAGILILVNLRELERLFLISYFLSGLLRGNNGFYVTWQFLVSESCIGLFAVMAFVYLLSRTIII